MQNIPPIEELIAAAKWRTNPTDPVNLRRSRGTEELADFACSILLKVPTQDDLHDVIEVLERAMYSEPIGESLRGELVGCVNVLKQICQTLPSLNLLLHRHRAPAYCR
jgi:hypothetical protein